MKKISIIILSAIVIFVGVFGFTQTVKANPTLFTRFKNIFAASSEVATTSPRFMTPGTATSTIYADSGQNESSFQSSVLAVQVLASSTGSIFNFRLEYADETPTFNCYSTPTACDWYTDSTLQTGVGVSTTTDSGINYIPTAQTYSWKYASTTEGCTTGSNITSVNRGCKLITVPTPTRYTRAVFWLPIGSTNGAVWAAFIAKRENN